MKLDDAQQQKVKEWVEAGLQPAEIQKRLVDECDVRLTYMEVRFLLDDLRVRLKDKVSAPPVTLPGAVGGLEPASKEPGTAGLSVSVDQVTRAGAVVSGKVTFRDGQSAEWYLDQTGRLGLTPQQPGYKPSQSDILAFQDELQSQLSRLGL